MAFGGRIVMWSLISHVQHDVRAGLGAADEHLSVGRRFQRVRGVADGAGQQGRGAGVADAGPAAPPGGDVAGVGELEPAAPKRVAMPLRAKVTIGPVPAGPGGWCGDRAACPVRPGLIEASAPNSSAWTRAGSTPAADRASRMSVMNEAGPQM